MSYQSNIILKYDKTTKTFEKLNNDNIYAKSSSLGEVRVVADSGVTVYATFKYTEDNTLVTYSTTINNVETTQIPLVYDIVNLYYAVALPDDVTHNAGEITVGITLYEPLDEGGTSFRVVTNAPLSYTINRSLINDNYTVDLVPAIITLLQNNIDALNEIKSDIYYTYDTINSAETSIDPDVVNVANRKYLLHIALIAGMNSSIFFGATVPKIVITQSGTDNYVITYTDNSSVAHVTTVAYAATETLIDLSETTYADTIGKSVILSNAAFKWYVAHNCETNFNDITNETPELIAEHNASLTAHPSILSAVQANATAIGTNATNITKRVLSYPYDNSNIIYAREGAHDIVLYYNTLASIGESTTGLSIVQRTETGQINVVETPIENSNAASKKYVNDNDAATLSGAEIFASGVAGAAERHANTYTNEHAILLTQKGAANGVAPLGSDSKISSTYLPSYVDDTIEVANYAALPTTGESGKIYVTLDTNLTYRWTGTQYTEISKSLALGETAETAYRGDRGKTAYDLANAHDPIVAANQTKLAKINTGSIVTDFNAITVNGFYTGYGTATGAPNTSNSWFILHQNSNAGNVYATQKAIAYSSTLTVYERVKYGSTWQNWVLKIGSNNEFYPFVEDSSSINANIYSHDCNSRQNIEITNNSANTIMYTNNNKNGYKFEMIVHGGYELDLTNLTVKKGADFSEIEIADNSQYYHYYFSYIINHWEVDRSVYNE